MTTETEVVAADVVEIEEAVRLGEEHVAQRYPVHVVPVRSLYMTLSTRVHGESPEHVRNLSEVATRLPPILVHRATMQVIDGVHRLRVATMRGDRYVDARFFGGSEADAFVVAVRLNGAHGLMLSRGDRKSAAARILRTHPQWSDRAVAAVVGLSDKTVAAIRRRSAAEIPQLAWRVGRDGRSRPRDPAEGRLRAGAVIADRPDASLREIAHAAGVSVTTARSVRNSMRTGPASALPRHGREPMTVRAGEAAVVGFDYLRRDPSLRYNESGRIMLQLLDANSVLARERDRLIDELPPHCTPALAKAARGYAEMWVRFASQLEQRG